eukprot:scaffold994_cov226-Prasinococcus_capsulatus_cf.AAC.8
MRRRWSWTATTSCPTLRTISSAACSRRDKGSPASSSLQVWYPLERGWRPTHNSVGALLPAAAAT